MALRRSSPAAAPASGPRSRVGSPATASRSPSSGAGPLLSRRRRRSSPPRGRDARRLGRRWRCRGRATRRGRGGRGVRRSRPARQQRRHRGRGNGARRGAGAVGRRARDESDRRLPRWSGRPCRTSFRAGGRCVNVSSTSGFLVGPGWAAYCTSKAGLIMLDALPGERLRARRRAVELRLPRLGADADGRRGHGRRRARPRHRPGGRLRPRPQGRPPEAARRRQTRSPPRWPFSPAPTPPT